MHGCRRKQNADGGCTFLLEGKLDLATGVHTKYGAPDTVWTEVVVDGKAAADTAADGGGAGEAASTSISLTSTWLNKTTTRMAEACWVSFVPKISHPTSGWAISSLGQMVDPIDVVAHGAVRALPHAPALSHAAQMMRAAAAADSPLPCRPQTHLHAMGADGAMVYNGPDGKLTIASLDVQDRANAKPSRWRRTQPLHPPKNTQKYWLPSKLSVTRWAVAEALECSCILCAGASALDRHPFALPDSGRQLLHRRDNGAGHALERSEQRLEC